MRKVGSSGDRQITPDPNCRLVRDKDFGNILFGCPPEIIKSFYELKETVPSNIVIPQRVFRKGRNIFDMEFITYSVLFSQKSQKSLNIICSSAQEARIRIILQEALFGPRFFRILSSFIMEPLKKFDFSKRQKKSLDKIIERLGSDWKIFSQFKETMALKPEKSTVISAMQPVIRMYLDKVSWIKDFAKNRIYRFATEAYVNAAMLKLEMNVFSLCDEVNNEKFLNEIIFFHHFDEKGSVNLPSPNGLRLRIRQTRNGLFKIYKKGKLCDTVDLQISEKNQDSWEAAVVPLEVPELGITFLGSGTGFDPKTFTASNVLWIDGKAIGVDLLANCEEHFMRLGIASNDITHIFLSHMHADHDAGIIEKIMWGEKTYLLTSRLIFESFLRKTEALTSVSQESIRELVKFVNLEPGKEIPVPGIERAYITFDYSFHSIPSGRFKLRYISRAGKEIKIGFSGDTKFDKTFVRKLHKEGILTAERQNEILGFLWDCHIVIHEAGGGILHTNVEELLKLSTSRKKKLLLTHVDHKTRKTKGLRFGGEGETISIIKRKGRQSVRDFLPMIKKTGLFSKLSARRIEQLLKDLSLETFSRGRYVFKQGDIGDKLYITVSGFAEVIKNDEVIAIYEKGSFFGELALINRDRVRRASVRAKSKLQLLSIERDIYQKFHLTTNISEKIYEFSNFFTESALSSLYGYISRGEFIAFIKGDEIIKFGDKDKDVYILLSGEVDILDSKGKVITHIDTVEILGEIAYLKEIPRTATVRVTSKEAATICLDLKLFSEIYEKFPSFYATTLKKMEQRLNLLNENKSAKKK